MIKVLAERTLATLLLISIALLLQVNSVAAEPYKTWNQLTPIQQEALQPLAAQWVSLPDKLQNNLLHAANRYQKLTPEQKRRFQSRLEKWSKLTPEQRERARNKYIFFRKAPPEKREQLKLMVQEQNVSKAITSSVPPDTSEH